VDVGTGDGRFVVRTAAAAATAATATSLLAIGVDASNDKMSEGVRRARKARLDNALFVVASAEQLPHELAGVAGLVTVHFPWGSLLEGIVGGDTGIVRGLAGLLRSAPERGAELRVLASVTPRDGVRVLGRFDRLDEDTAPAVSAAITRAARPVADLTTIECRPAVRVDIEAAHSTWGKRLLAAARASATPAGVSSTSAARPVWLLRFGTTTA